MIVARLRNRGDQRLGQIPMLEQSRRQLNMVEPQRSKLHLAEIRVRRHRLADQSGIGPAKAAQQHKHAQVLQQPSEECIVAGPLENLLADLAGRNRAD
jgi:hypothetical protein